MRRGLLRSLATVSGMTMASRVLGFVRQILIAGVIGAGGNPVADAFWAAFRLPNMFRRLFAEGAFHAAFIPLFQGAEVNGGKDEAKAFAEETLAALLFVLLLLTALVEIAAPLFVYLIASGFAGDAEKFSLATLYTRIMFPYLACMSVVGLLSGVLNSLGRFAASAGAPLALNVCMMIAIIAFADADSEVAGEALAWSVFASGVAQLLWLWWGAAREGYRPRFRRPRLTPGVKRLLVLGAPGFLSAGAIQINLLIGTNIASQEPGAVSWLMNADQLYQLPLAIFGIALGIVLLPLLSRRLKEGDSDGAAHTINRSLEFSALLAFPAATGFIMLGAPLCDALYRGVATEALTLFGGRSSAFTEHDVAMTGAALALFGWGLPAFVWHKVFSPAFFAREDTKSPMNFALISIAANTVLALALFPFFGFLAVAFATSVASWIQIGLLAWKLARIGQFRPNRRLWSRLVRILIANLALAGLLWVAVQHTDVIAGVLFGRQWLAIIAIVILGAAAYGAFSLAVGAARLSDYKTGGAADPPRP